MGRFADRVRKWGQKTEQRMDATFRGASLEALTRLILSTPVDSGLARGNWQVSFDMPSQGFIDRHDASGNLTIADGTGVINRASSDVTLYITNSLPYIRRLEFGHSKQGANMVAKLVSDWDGIVRQAASNAERAYP